MWQDKLKEIIYILENSNINEIEVVFWGRKYRVKKNPDISSSSFSQDKITTSGTQEEKVLNKINGDDKEAKENIIENIDSTGSELLSPMPGTFYDSPSPDDPPFVKIGDEVKEGQVLCIIEAMKIMNEIEAESSGVISKVLVNNSDPVEYNQPLYIISK